MRCLVSFFFLSALSLFAVSLPHQGRVLISGDPFNGTGYFRFALVDQAGEIVWNHQGTYGEPETDITIDVAKGYYQCRLGDTSIDGMAELPSSIFVPDHPLKLRIWFNDGVNGLKRLGQDQNLMMAPYAMTSPRSASEKIAMRFADEIIRQAGTSNISVDALIERISSFAQQATQQGTITKDMLPADLFNEMNKTVQMFHDSQSMIEDLNSSLNQALIAIDRPISKSMLGADVLADLNRTKDASDGHIEAGSIGITKLDPVIIKYLKPEIVSQTTLNSLGSLYQGKIITLSLNAEGKFITYQWQKDGVNLEGETHSNLNLGSFTPLNQNGTYRAIVTNDFGSVLTEPVTLFRYVSPVDLNSTAPLTIKENLPAGTFVGQFTANDPDDGNLTYNLEDGESPDHAFFRLESNGSLFTSTTFDFENDKSSYSLMVAVRDQDGGVMYDFFTVFLVGEDFSTQSSFIWENEELDLNELDQFMSSQNANYSKTGQVEPVAYSRDLWDISQDRRADKYAYFDGVVQSYAPMQYTETNAEDPNGYNDLLHSDIQGPFAELIHDERTLYTEKMEDTVVPINDVDYHTKVYKMREVIGFESLNGIEYHEERTRVLWINQEFGLLKWTEENNLYSDLLGGASTPLIDENFSYFLIREDAELDTEPSTHTVELNSSVNLEMIWVEPGTFTMGQDGVATPVHEVTLTQGFYLGKYEVTQAQYEAVMAGNTDGLSATPSHWPNNPDRPVEWVSYDDIQKFLTRLNSQQAGNIPDGWAYVLPTEAQWEYACRAGTTRAYSWGDSITADDANYNWDDDDYLTGADFNDDYLTGADFKQTRDVGQYSANPWGFFDMHGNVWEWTADVYASYVAGAQTDPFNDGAGSGRVARGGSWQNSGTLLRSAYRNFYNPSSRYDNIGFRVGFQQQ